MWFLRFFYAMSREKKCGTSCRQGNKERHAEVLRLPESALALASLAWYEGEELALLAELACITPQEDRARTTWRRS
jgi:hypothetical protein